METMEHKGITIEIHPEENPESPREWDNVDTMVCAHKRYGLGDKHDYKSADYRNWDDIEQAIIKNEKPAVILPLYLLDHSGITIRASSESFRAQDSMGWDWGQVGFIFVSKENARKEYGKLTKKVLETIKKVLLAEVEEYDQFLQGDVWGYVVDPKGEHDSCWGFYGYDYCVTEAKAVADRIAEKVTA